MIDVAVLAGIVVTKLLAPVFRAGWDKVFDAATEQVGEEVAEETKGVVSRVWTKLKGVFTSDEEKAALTSFEKRPDAAAPLLQDLLREKLAADPGLAEEFDRLVNARPAGGVLNGAQVIGRTVNQVVAQGPVSGHAIVAGQVFGAVPPFAEPRGPANDADGRPAQ